MYKKLMAAIIAAAFFVPTVAKAEGAIIGTDAYGLVQGGAANVFFQGKLSDSSAYLIEFMTASGVNVFQGSYKMYFGGEYANAPYVAAGLLYATAAGGSITGFSGKVGYDFTLGESVVLSPYYGVLNISGFTGGGIGFNVGFKL